MYPDGTIISRDLFYIFYVYFFIRFVAASKSNTYYMYVNNECGIGDFFGKLPQTNVICVTKVDNKSLLKGIVNHLI